MTRYNLIDEPWIPLMLQDGTRAEWGIRDTLLRANEIAAIEDASPLVVGALHRFLLAVLYRSLRGPCDIREALAYCREGFPGDRIRAYLDQWRDRFWLFHDTHPFSQNPAIPAKETEPWTKLTPEFNATTNKVLFDHTDTRSPGTRSAAACARWLLATLQFSVAGGRGYFPSPSASGMMCLPLGGDLASTIRYNLVPYPNREVMEMDSAIWERDPMELPLLPPKRVPRGYADLYTWPSRMLLFEEEPTGDVSLTRFVTGLGCEAPNPLRDPMHPCRIDKELGLLPLRFDPTRRTWRSFDSLIPDATGLAPRTIDHAAALEERGLIASPRAFLVLGLRNEPPNANLEFWRLESFQVPGSLARRPELRAHCKELLEDAEDTGKALANACSTFAKALLRHGHRPSDPKDLSYDPKELKAALAQITCLPTYWATLETAFHGVLQALGSGREFFSVQKEWHEAIQAALKGAWAQHRLATQTGGAWALRALAKAEGPLARELRRLESTIKAATTYLAEEQT